MQQRLSGVDAGFSLARLLQPLTVETFINEIWGATHYHVSRNRPEYFDNLLDGSASVDELVGLFRPDLSLVRMVRENDKKDPYLYRLANGGLDVAAIGKDFAAGYTMVLESIHRYVRAIAALSQSIDVELNFATQVNAYVTPPESQGFIAHYDEHDVLILQIRGSKIWHLYDGADMAPTQMCRQEPVSTAALPSPTDVRLEVGDVLYLPRGQVHAAESTSELSVHLTVGVQAPTLLMLATRALDSLSYSDDRVHAQLPPRYLDDPDVRASLGVLVRDIAEALEQPSAIAEGLGSLQDDLVKRGQCPTVGQAISNAVEIDGRARVRKYQPLYSRVTDTSAGVALHFAQLVINAAADHRDALQFLSKSTEPFRIRDLPGLSATQQTELVRTLIVNGFLVRLPDD
ncbi:MAG: bifunctional lysine-specific demethylase and histidyl-hydroxylase [Mycobacterium sp.]|nr:bifunctional lysine-specific demethylase and histidyl-hydroxylase [Mycobacterium sp.]